jgi:hypothetical protein
MEKSRLNGVPAAETGGDFPERNVPGPDRKRLVSELKECPQPAEKAGYFQI